MHGFILLLLAALLQQTTPSPRPFPQPPTTQPARPPAPSSPPPSTTSPLPPVEIPVPPTPTSPQESELGVPVYPTAQFITTFDAGMGQRFHLFGAPAPFAEVVKYYQNILKSRGEALFVAPAATHQFEIGRYREETMAFPPSVTVKEYGTAGRGYPNPKGNPPVFNTIIQIVPAPPQGAREPGE